STSKTSIGLKNFALFRWDVAFQPPAGPAGKAETLNAADFLRPVSQIFNHDVPAPVCAKIYQSPNTVRATLIAFVRSTVENLLPIPILDKIEWVTENVDLTRPPHEILKTLIQKSLVESNFAPTKVNQAYIESATTIFETFLDETFGPTHPAI